MTKKVFISYKREDRTRVKELAETLRRAGNIVWFDESIQVGDHWWDSILEQIEQCDVFLFAISQIALRSIPCQKERAYADELGKPFLLIQVGPVSAVPREYLTIQYGNFSKGDQNTLFDLIGAINRLQGGQPNNPNAVRPNPPIPPIEELAAIIDTQAKLDFKDQAEILLRLQEAIDGPQARTRALELVEVLSKRTEFVRIKEDCGAILAANKDANRPMSRSVLLGGLLVVVLILGIGGIAFWGNRNTDLPAVTSTSLALNPTDTPTIEPTGDIYSALAGTKQTPRVVPTQTPQISATPAITNTPRPTRAPTATSIFVASGVKPQYVLDFVNATSEAFTYRGYGSWRAIPISSNKISPGMGILLEFQIAFQPSTPGDMSFWLNSGDFGTTSYLAWDVTHGDSGWVIAHENKNHWAELLHFNFAMQKDKWYYLLWRINPDGTLDTLIWEKGNTSTYVLKDLQRAYGSSSSVDWRSWVFNLNLDTADVMVARYEELQFPDDYVLPSTPPTSGLN